MEIQYKISEYSFFTEFLQVEVMHFVTHGRVLDPTRCDFTQEVLVMMAGTHSNESLMKSSK